MNIGLAVRKYLARWHKVFDFTIQLLIILSLITFSVETLPDLDPVTRQWLRYVEVFTVSVFTVEYIVRLIVAKKKLKFIFSFFGMVDLISILPFYLTTGV
ncbi:MAG: ion transporter, partial [Cyanobacteria bacterium J06555_3]